MTSLNTPADDRNLLVSALQACVDQSADGVLFAAGRPPTLKTRAVLTPLPHPKLSEEDVLNLLSIPEDDVPAAAHFRISTWSGGAFFRRLSPRPLALSELGLPPELHALSSETSGLVVIAGASGSGVTTTLHAYLEKAAGLAVVIDHAERVLPGVVQVRPHDGNPVRFALQSGADVVAFGDVADRSLIPSAVHVAEAGKRVFLAMTARGVSDVIRHLLGHAHRRILASLLQGVIVQRLLPGNVLAVEYALRGKQLDELLRGEVVRELGPFPDDGEPVRARTLQQSLAALVKAGRVREEDARAAALDVGELKKLLGG